MNILLVHPGAPFSTSDVYDGYLAGLRALGMDVGECRLDRYIQFCGGAVEDAGLHQANTIALASAFVAQRALIDWPDLLIAVGATNLHRGTAAALTRAGLRTAAILIDSPYLLSVEAQLASAYTYVTTNERTSVATLRDVAERVRYLPTAYNPERHTPDGPHLSEDYDVSFIGSMFAERKALFEAADLGGLRVCIDGLNPDPAATGRRVFENAGVASLYRSTRVNLNHHRTTMVLGDGRTAEGCESLGPRAYEIAACGGFQLMDDTRTEACELFGAALATYRAGDGDDLSRQARYWLTQDSERERMATEQRAAVAGHSYTDRARALLEWAL